MQIRLCRFAIDCRHKRKRSAFLKLSSLRREKSTNNALLTNKKITLL